MLYIYFQSLVLPIVETAGHTVRVSVWLGELLPVATTTKKGLMPLEQKWNTNNWETYTGDLNDIKRESRLVINKNTKNNPINQWAVCETVYINSGFSLQKVYEYFAARTIYVRSYNNSAWSNWTKIVG